MSIVKINLRTNQRLIAPLDFGRRIGEVLGLDRMQCLFNPEHPLIGRMEDTYKNQRFRLRWRPQARRNMTDRIWVPGLLIQADATWMNSQLEGWLPINELEDERLRRGHASEVGNRMLTAMQMHMERATAKDATAAPDISESGHWYDDEDITRGNVLDSIENLKKLEQEDKEQPRD